jgi:hypothetical protein
MSVASTSTKPQSEPATAASQPRTWLREIIPSGQIVETCPAWCTASHLTDARGMLDDLVHVGAPVEKVMDELGPEEFATVIAQIRAHADALEGVLAQLVQARAEHAGVTTAA